MAAVRIWIDKFNGVVLIDEDHPLAVAQRAKGSADAADTQPASAQAASAPSVPAPEPTRKKRKG